MITILHDIQTKTYDIHIYDEVLSIPDDEDVMLDFAKAIFTKLGIEVVEK